MYICSSCEYSSNIKLGKCPNCGEFGSMIQDLSKIKISKKNKNIQWEVLKVSENSKNQEKANKLYKLQNTEFQRIFWQWLQSGGVYLIWWEPGIGKSTIIIQIVNELTYLNDLTIGEINQKTNIDSILIEKINIWYFSAEEQVIAVQKRQERLCVDNTKKNNISIFYSPRLEDIIQTCISSDYDVLIIDSIQTIYSSEIDSIAGSIQQVRFCSEKIVEVAKKYNITILIIWHITKWWEIAGPKYLEHIVDVVIYIEWQRFGNTRFIKAKKNRFWPTDEVGIFEMTNVWLIPIYDFDNSIVSNSDTNRPWCVLTVGINGIRPIFGSIETLTNKSYGKFPSRNVVGVDPKRLDMILAILDKYCNTKFATMDVYINIPWEVVFKDSGIDLGIAVALLSNYFNKVFDPKWVYIWEIWLSGKVLNTSFHNKRLSLTWNKFNIYDFKNITNIEKILKL